MTIPSALSYLRPHEPGGRHKLRYIRCQQETKKVESERHLCSQYVLVYRHGTSLYLSKSGAILRLVLSFVRRE